MQEDIIIMKLHTPNNIASKYVKEKQGGNKDFIIFYRNLRIGKNEEGYDLWYASELALKKKKKKKH